MATIDWPTLRCFVPRNVVVGVRAPKAAWAAFFTGDMQTQSHLADRLVLTLELPACDPDNGALREAWVNELVSTGDWVRLGHLVRPMPRGTLRGAPTVAVSALAGARTLQLQGVVGDTLLGGDVLGSGAQLLPVAYAGATANGAGVLSVRMQVPLRRPLVAGAAVAWQAPFGTFQLLASELDVGYGKGCWQQAITLPFREVFAI